MRFDLSGIYKGCPKELEEEFCNLYYPCSRFIMNSQIFPHFSEDLLTMRLSETKEKLVVILAKFSSLLNQNYEPKRKYELSLKLKFIEDIGEVHKSIDKETILKNLNSQSKLFPIYYNIINDFLSVFDFIVYQPIIAVNKKSIGDLKQYIEEVFKISSANAAILGHSIRSENKSPHANRGVLSKSSTTVLNEFEEEGSGEEEDGKEEESESEEPEVVEIKPVKKRGRPRKKKNV